MAGIMRVVLALVLALAGCALFVRTYSVPPGPDRQGGTVLMLAAPNRPLFGSPHGDCLATPESEPAIRCLIASFTAGRLAGLARLSRPFCLTCYDLSQRLAVRGLDEKAVRVKQEQIARFGW